MSLKPNLRRSPTHRSSSQRLPVPPPVPVGPPVRGNASKMSSVGNETNVASGSMGHVVARRSSPPRRTGEEITFQKKLDEIKRMRSKGNTNGENRMTTALLNQVDFAI